MPKLYPDYQPSAAALRDPNSLHYYRQRFLDWMQEKQYAATSVVHTAHSLGYFIAWCDERGLLRPHDLTKPILERYLRALFLYRKANGAPLSTRTQHGRIIPVRNLFKWLARNNHILYNPASDLDLPRLEQRLPRHILTVAEVETILAQPDLDTAMGVRDRALLETFYSTGIRRMELIGLAVRDIDHERGTVMVRQGKGKKDRMVPIGDRALAWVAKYRDDVRPELAMGNDGGTLFLNYLGEPFSPAGMTELVRNHIETAKVGKAGSCHLFRHTMATLMLENGADIRFIQALLGHASLDTTQIYTQVSIRKLKDIHTATHPGRPIVGRSGQASPTDGTVDHAALLAALDQEASEEDNTP